MDATDLATPPWMSRLASALTPHLQRAPRLTLLDVAAELCAWSEDTTPGNPLIQSPENLKSLSEDFRICVGEVGPLTASLAADALQACTAALVLARGVARRAGQSPEQVEAAIMAINESGKELWLALRQPALIRATWLDIVSVAVDSESKEGHEAKLASLLLRQLDQSRRGGESLIREVAGILRGNELPWEPPVPVAERVSTIAARLEAEPREDSVVVWLGYRGAQGGSRSLEAGPITFLSAWALDQESRTADDPLGAELERVHGTMLAPGDDNDLRRVDLLARIDLGRRPIHGSRRDAILLVDTVLGLSSHWGTGWMPELRGSVVLGAGGYAGSVGRGRSRAEPSDYELSAAFRSVQEYGPDLAKIFFKGDLAAQLKSAIEAQRAADSVRDRNHRIFDPGATEMRLVIAYEDRVIQQLTGFARVSRHELVNAARRVDAIADWAGEVDRAVQTCLAGHSFDDEKAMLRGRYLQRGGWAHCIGFAREHHAVLLRYLDDGEYDRRWVTAVLESIDDADERLRRIELRMEATNVLERRRKRVRNAIAHGNPLNDDVTRSVGPYSDRLSREILSAAIDDLGKSTGLLAALERSTGHWTKIWDGVPTSEILAEYMNEGRSVDTQ